MSVDLEFLKKLREAFQIEATEHLEEVSNTLLSLEKNPGLAQSQASIEKMLRNFHSLKGSSRAVNLSLIEKTCQEIESILVEHKSASRELSADLTDDLYKLACSMLSCVTSLDLASGNTSGENELEKQLTGALSRASKAPELESNPISDYVSNGGDSPGENQEDVKVQHPLASLSTGTMRVSVDRMEEIVKRLEELVYAKLVADQRLTDCDDLQSILGKWTRQWHRIRPEVENEAQKSGHKQKNYIQEFIDLHDSFVGRLQEKLLNLENSFQQEKRITHNLVDGLLEKSRELTMTPFSVLQDLFERIVRDIAKQQSKDVKLILTGGETEIDRHILDDFKEPMIHLLRNSIDHGIESTKDRLEKGKPEQSNIRVTLSMIDSGKVEISIKDDGRGIDLAKIKERAVSMRIMTPEKAEETSEQQLYALLFRSSFSTKDEVSDISGRGIGLAIVKETIEKLGGQIEIDSKLNEGTTFRMIVPVRRATMFGVTAVVDNQTLVVPTSAIRSAIRVRDCDSRIVQGRWTLTFGERLVPMVWLADILDLDNKVDHEEAVALICGKGDYPVAILVEEVTGEQEVAVSPLPTPLTRVRHITGATLLKTGDLAAVINVNDVLSSAHLLGSNADALEARRARKAKTGSNAATKKILVTDDSITSRVLLKNILESNDYQVEVANDGEDAWQKLQTKRFDLLITDVEMPKMSGFELTKKIRTESTFSDMPIIVVTSLASLEDRKTGVEVGASAYFVKSNFEKSNLIDMVKRLI
ncbi:MAG: response regulator [Candidatus Melainabacteria bacterium]|nr:response regulator [Candidatus Melainabacteria bacterium]